MRIIPQAILPGRICTPSHHSSLKSIYIPVVLGRFYGKDTILQLCVHPVFVSLLHSIASEHKFRFSNLQLLTLQEIPVSPRKSTEGYGVLVRFPPSYVRAGF